VVIGSMATRAMKATMTTKTTTWAAQIAVAMLLLATGTASASSGLLSANSPRDKNPLEGSFHRVSASVSGEPHQGWGEVCAGSAADSVVAPRTPSGLPKDIHDLGVGATKGDVTHADWVARTTAQQRQQMADFFREAAGRVNVENAPGAREFNLYRARWLETGQGPSPGNIDNFRRNILPTLPPNFGG
jgi:hypothetical protein